MDCNNYPYINNYDVLRNHNIKPNMTNSVLNINVNTRNLKIIIYTVKPQ